MASTNGAWKVVAVLIGSLLVGGISVLGFVYGQAASAESSVVALMEKHQDDMSTVRERLSVNETYQREVLRRLIRIEQKLEGR